MSQIDRPKLHEVLDKLMQEVGINEAELARKTEIPQPTLHRILSGATKSPRGNSLAPLANFFSVTINQLLGVDELPADRVAGTHNSRIYGWTPVPHISWENAASWSSFQHELRSQTWHNWISTDLAVTDAAFAITVIGDSMLPIFTEGTALIIEPTLEPNNRDYVILKTKTGTQALFRQLLIDGNDRYLKPINGEFRTVEYGKETEIIGVVVQSRMDFRRTN